MATRRQAREWAVQMLVQFDLNPPSSVPAGMAAFWEQQAELERTALSDGERVVPVFLETRERARASLAGMQAFAAARVEGVMSERDALDAALAPYLDHWEMFRLGTVERNVLRLGAWELLHAQDVPAPIVVNEAVDLAKWFSETKSGRFVNGVLDRFAKRSGAKARDAGGGTDFNNPHTSPHFGERSP